MLLFSSRLRSYRDLPMRYAEAAVAAPRRADGHAARAHARRQFSQDDAHVFCTAEQIQDEIDAMFDYAAYLYDRSASRGSRRALDAARQQARHGRGVGLHRGRAPDARSTAWDPYTVAEGEARSTARRSTCT
jgi:hypothetical protein